MSMNTQCHLPLVTVVAGINSNARRRHHPLRLKRVASIGSHALMGIAALTLVPGVLTPISLSYATRALAMLVGHTVSILLWCHFIARRTSSGLVRVSRITSLACWTTLLLQLGSSGAMRWVTVLIISVKRTTPCEHNLHPWGRPSNPLLNPRARAHLSSVGHPPPSHFQGGGFRAPCPINIPCLIRGKSPNHHHHPVHRPPCPHRGNYSSHHPLQLPMSQLTLKAMSIWMPTLNSLSSLKGYLTLRGHSTTWRDNCSQIPMGQSGPAKY